jgi:hypothetical protein
MCYDFSRPLYFASGTATTFTYAEAVNVLTKTKRSGAQTTL